MLRCELNQARPGMRLALPVMNPQVPGKVLLRVGFELDHSIITRLNKLAIRTLWIEYPGLEFIDKFIDQKQLQTKQEVVTQIKDTFTAIQGEATAKLDFDRYTKTIGTLVDQILNNPKTNTFMDELDVAGDELLQHSSSTTFLALMMGLRLEGYLVSQRPRVNPTRAKEVANLGVGAMLHDVGVPLLEEDVRQRYMQTQNEHDAEWQQHPTLGFRVVRGKVDPSAAAVVLHHHQRFDGEGYTGEFPVLSGESIHIFARIVAVAEAYDRLRHPANQDPQPAVWVLSSMLATPTCDRFDPNVLRALTEVVPPYPPGSTVRLSDRRHAIVIDHNAKDPCRPKVIPLEGELNPEEGLPEIEPLDLSKEDPMLHIAVCDDQPVAEFNFGPERVPGNLQTLAGWG